MLTLNNTSTSKCLICNCLILVYKLLEFQMLPFLSFLLNYLLDKKTKWKPILTLLWYDDQLLLTIILKMFLQCTHTNNVI